MRLFLDGLQYDDDSRERKVIWFRSTWERSQSIFHLSVSPTYSYRFTAHHPQGFSRRLLPLHLLLQLLTPKESWYLHDTHGKAPSHAGTSFPSNTATGPPGFRYQERCTHTRNNFKSSAEC